MTDARSQGDEMAADLLSKFPNANIDRSTLGAWFHTAFGIGADIYIKSQPPPGVGPALSALIEHWRDFASKPVGYCAVQGYEGIRGTLSKCADELEAALSGSVGGLNAAPPVVKDCQWAIDDVGGDSVYETSCGHNFYFDDSTYADENSFKFCAYCGGRLVEVKTSEALPASPVCAAEKKEDQEKIYARSHLHDDSGTAPTEREK